MGRKGEEEMEEEESMLEARKGVCVCVETAGCPIKTDKELASIHTQVSHERREKKRKENTRIQSRYIRDIKVHIITFFSHICNLRQRQFF